MDYKWRSKYAIYINQGCTAKIKGEPLEANPYEVGSEQHKAWAHGWERTP